MKLEELLRSYREENKLTMQEFAPDILKVVLAGIVVVFCLGYYFGKSKK